MSEKEHWTRKLQRENEQLRLCVSRLMSGCHEIVQSRFQKKAEHPSSDDYSLGYVACATEIDLRMKFTLLDPFTFAGIECDRFARIVIIYDCDDRFPSLREAMDE